MPVNICNSVLQSFWRFQLRIWLFVDLAIHVRITDGALAYYMFSGFTYMLIIRLCIVYDTLSFSDSIANVLI